MVLMAITAILFQRSATATWAEARTENGHRMLVSPIGIQDWGPDSASRPIAECRWWPKLGDSSLCAVAPGGEDDVKRVRRAYPLTFIALWGSVLALFLVALRLPRQAPSVGLFVTAAVPIVAVVGLWQFATSFANAFAVFADARVTVQPFGFVAALVGAFLMALAVGLLVTSRVLKR